MTTECEIQMPENANQYSNDDFNAVQLFNTFAE